MNKIYTYKETKEELKVLASEIKDIKSKRKEVKDGNLNTLGLYRKQWDYRIKHIAMSMFRGKTLEQIEPTAKYEYPTKEYFVLNAESYLSKLVYEREEEHEEALCDCA